MSKRIKIDFVADVSCPWCAIGLGGLEAALERLKGEVEADIVLQPFQLNPGMVHGGENLDQHLAAKYGSDPERLAVSREAVRERGRAVGIEMAQNSDSRIYNTFDAHRLLRWAAEQGQHLRLLHALFTAYFTVNRDISDRALLVALAEMVGLDPAEAFVVLSSDRYVDEIVAAEDQWREAGISSVPATIVNDKYLIPGGQPPEGFEHGLRTVLAEI